MHDAYYVYLYKHAYHTFQQYGVDDAYVYYVYRQNVKFMLPENLSLNVF